MTSDVAALAGRPVVVGAGLAGLIAALELAPRPVVVLSPSPLGEGAASAWSQGGIAAAVLPEDSPALHAVDTIAAGDGLCDPAVVRRITDAGPDAVALLVRLGARFARDAAGRFLCKLEAAHSRPRVLNAGGDGTGAEIMRAVVAMVRRTPSITVLEGASAAALVVGDRGVDGIVLSSVSGHAVLPTRAVVIATGGVGSLWQHTTNPPGARAGGLVLAARAGAALADLEFVQFHPTALDVGLDPMPLASEAMRGEGATLVDETGRRFMAGIGRAELEPRDVVARAVWAELVGGHRVFLDTRATIGAALPRRFPGIAAKCRAAGLDPVEVPMPIRPAAHYHMGGVAVDARGRSGIDGLWACGEASGTGLHGANRLASNSLLEAVVTARAVAEDIAGIDLGPPRLGVEGEAPPRGEAELAAVRAVMSAEVGVLRDGEGLRRAVAALLPLARTGAASATAGLMIAVAAYGREESRGAHCRTDFPAADPAQARRRTLTLAEAFAMAGDIAR